MINRAEIPSSRECLELPIEYAFLDEVELSEEQIRTTIQTYDAYASVYSGHEWGNESVEVVWESIFSKLRANIQDLPQNSQVLIAGCGTLKDLITLNLLRSDLNIYGFDISTEMLNVGLKKLVFSEVLRLATLIDKIDSLPHGWIAHILELMKQIDIPEFNEITENFVIKKIREKIQLIQGDVRIDKAATELRAPEGYFFKDESFELIMAIAVLPHIPKLSAKEAVIDMLRLLKPNGVLHFNLKIDADNGVHKRKKGRVFKDSVLGGDRYFNTYTMAEFMDFMSHIQSKVPGLQVLIDYSLSKHPDTNKPPFINVTITKTG